LKPNYDAGVRFVVTPAYGRGPVVQGF